MAPRPSIIRALACLGSVLGASVRAQTAPQVVQPEAVRPPARSRAVAGRDSAADAAVFARVRDEGMTRSRVAETATILSDVFGPRLAGSSAWGEAAEWARRTLAGYGLSARLEPWGTRRGNR